MNGPEPSLQIDSVLLPFLYAENEQEAKQHLEVLIASAAPGIEKITKASRTPEDAFQEVALRLIKHLRELRSDRERNVIGNYSHYVKVVASRTVKGQVREQYPRYRSMVDSLRHLFRRNDCFACWESGGQRLCGFSFWRESGSVRIQSHRLTALLNNPRGFDDPDLPSDTTRAGNNQLLLAIFKWVGHPIRFDELAKIVCAIKRITDASTVSINDNLRTGLGDWLPDQTIRPDDNASQRQFLRRLWANIEELPRLQRLAYLLNFTAGDGQLELFWMYGIASIRHIGVTLQLTEVEFERIWAVAGLEPRMVARAKRCQTYDEKFALLWQILPLPDALISNMLETDRQKVINLRKAAGDRLSRHLGRDRTQHSQ